MIPTRYQGYEQSVSVACVNTRTILGDKQAMLAKLEANIEEAALQGADIVVFSEGALSGPGSCEGCRSLARTCDAHVALAETVPGPSTQRIARLAADRDVYVVFGLCERDPAEERVLYNAAAVVGPDGIQGTYRKLHLGVPPWVTEGISYRPGNQLPLFETRYGPIGIQICYDFWFNPELSRLLALKGARLILNACGTYAGPGKREYMVHTTCTRAQENLVYAASANQVGGPPDADSYAAGHLDGPRADCYLGHSVIAGPAFPRFSQVFAEAGDGEEIALATLSFERLHRWQSVFPWRDWRATRQAQTSELVAKEFQALAATTLEE